MQPDPGGVDGAAVADDDQGVGELVHGDRGQAQADHDGDLRRVDPQDEVLARGDGGEDGGQPGQGQQDLGGDRGGAEQVPGAAGVGGGHQPPGAGPPHLQPRAAELHARGRGGGGGSLARNPCSRSSATNAAVAGLRRRPARVQLVADFRFGVGELDQPGRCGG